MYEFDKIRKRLLKTKELFEDNDFPCLQSSVLYTNDSIQFVWKRPKEICSNPVFISDASANYFNLTAGKLGNYFPYFYLSLSLVNSIKMMTIL
jgi:calpain-3